MISKIYFKFTKFFQQLGEFKMTSRSRNFIDWRAISIGDVSDVIVAIQDHRDECLVVT